MVGIKVKMVVGGQLWVTFLTSIFQFNAIFFETRLSRLSSQFKIKMPTLVTQKLSMTRKFYTIFLNKIYIFVKHLKKVNFKVVSSCYRFSGFGWKNQCFSPIEDKQLKSVK